MFKYSVIGNNTKENIEHLEMLGYKPIAMFLQQANYIVTSQDGIYYSLDHKNVFLNAMQRHDINCLGNAPFFKAVSDMREDSDKYQLFIDDVDNIFICNTSKLVTTRNCRKATLSELINHFK